MKRMEHPCSAGSPACGVRGLSSPRFLSSRNHTEPESSVNPQAGIPALYRRPRGAAPLPVFRTLAKACVYRIHRRVMATAMHVILVANEMVKRFSLPKLFARPLQELVRFARGVALPVLQNLAQCPAWQRSQSRVNVIRHDHPGSQLVTCAGKKFGRARNQLGDVMLAQPPLPVAGIKVGIDARRIPAEQLLLFVPRQRTLGGERLSKDRFTLCFKLKQDFPWQGASQTKHHEIGSSVALEMRE